MPKCWSKNSSGFTLVELLIVVTIIGILSGLLISIINPTLMQNRAKDAVLAANAAKLAQAVEAYKAVTGSYPTSLSTLVDETYIKSMPTDASYTYVSAAGNYCLSAPSIATTNPQTYFKYVGSCPSSVTCKPGTVQVNCLTSCTGGSGTDFACDTSPVGY